MTCERVIIINNGNIVAVDTPDNLTLQLSGGTRIELEVSGPTESLPETLSAIEGVKQVTGPSTVDSHQLFYVEMETTDEIRHRLVRSVIESGCELYQIRTDTMTLEEVFLKLTTEEEAA